MFRYAEEFTEHIRQNAHRYSAEKLNSLIQKYSSLPSKAEWEEKERKKAERERKAKERAERERIKQKAKEKERFDKMSLEQQQECLKIENRRLERKLKQQEKVKMDFAQEFELLMAKTMGKVEQ